MRRRPPRSTLSSSSAASDVYKRQVGLSKLLSCFCCCCSQGFVVDEGYIRCGEDGSGGYPMYGPGVHFYCSPFLAVQDEIEICSTRITNGPHTICTIQQGHCGVCEDMGQPLLLPPGMHQWHSPTLKFENEVDLSSNIVRLGPYTVVTVDEGYAAITQDNGKQVILPGGTTTVLRHRNWRFEKFMSMKLNSNDLKAIEATSADNVNLHVEATVVWQVCDVAAAARMAADTMERGNRYESDDTMDISKLCEDVLKQARASLAMYIGELRYMDTFHLSATIQEQRRKGGGHSDMSGAGQVGPNGEPPEYTKLYDQSRMAASVAHANSIAERYGVEVISINIISAVPVDQNLRQALAKGALAVAQAEQIETQARAEAKAASIMVETENSNLLARAQAEADAARIRADGQKQSAALIESSELASELARLDAMQGVLSDKSAFFFGSDASHLSSILTNPKLVGK
eukprot:TRINITY_DN21339_c0_g1_i1.p1 TRINITY_DN21339_c0_g1~~TRINITY_DN21339_c0_g1_i1.p1  ORF type:complete len:459 (+),score=111.46 TRINITY_DN21339_c0_g1_i1:56-1432(+)